MTTTALLEKAIRAETTEVVRRYIRNCAEIYGEQMVRQHWPMTIAKIKARYHELRRIKRGRKP